MLPHPDRDSDLAACDMRAAIAACGGGLLRPAMSPDAAAAEVAARFVGPPARPRQGDEPVLIYPQGAAPALCFGLYGGERRVRDWLPGLPGRIAPGPLAGFAGVAPRWAETGLHAERPVDLTALPVPQVTPRDAGRYLTMGFVMAQAPDGSMAISAHRMLILGPDRLGIWMLPGRALRHLAQAAHDAGRSLPVTINIGVPPAVAIAAATSTATLPRALDKLAIAGAFAGRPISLSEGSAAPFLTRAEIVLEAELTAETAPEALPGAPLAGSMPEFLGYDGHGVSELHVLRLTRCLMRPDALFQTVIGPGREQSVILGLGGALSLGLALSPDWGLHDLRFAPAGGGMLLLYAALAGDGPRDLAALARAMAGVCPFLKTVVFVDEDIDISCDEDVLWALTTRAQLAQDCHALPGFRPLGMDPSQSPEWQAARGTSVFKSYVDATVPPPLRPAFRRALP